MVRLPDPHLSFLGGGKVSVSKLSQLQTIACNQFNNVNNILFRKHRLEGTSLKHELSPLSFMHNFNQQCLKKWWCTWWLGEGGRGSS